MEKIRQFNAEDFAKLREWGAITQEEVAYWYGFSTQTLEQWRCHKVGPTYYKTGRRVLYRVSDIESFLDQCRVQTTGV